MMYSDICIVEPECTSEQEAQNKGDLQGCGYSESGFSQKNAGKVGREPLCWWLSHVQQWSHLLLPSQGPGDVQDRVSAMHWS